MKIYVLGSNRFLQEMLDCTNKLREIGMNGWIHPDYEAFGRGEKMDIWNRAHKGEHVQVKKRK